MNDEQQRMIAALSKCGFGTGTSEKRFVADMVRKLNDNLDGPLSPRQDWYLRRTFWRYRRQIGHDMPKPADFDEPPVKQAEPVPPEAIVCRKTTVSFARARELEKLKAWNEGRGK